MVSKSPVDQRHGLEGRVDPDPALDGGRPGQVGEVLVLADGQHRGGDVVDPWALQQPAAPVFEEGHLVGERHASAGRRPCAAVQSTSPWTGSSASTVGRPPASVVTAAVSTAWSARTAAVSGLTATVAAKPRAPRYSTRTPTPISTSSAADSRRPSRSRSAWERIRSTRTWAWLHPRLRARSRAASRTRSISSASRDSSAVTAARYQRWFCPPWEVHRLRAGSPTAMGSTGIVGLTRRSTPRLGRGAPDPTRGAARPHRYLPALSRGGGGEALTTKALTTKALTQGRLSASYSWPRARSDGPGTQARDGRRRRRGDPWSAPPPPRCSRSWAGAAGAPACGYRRRRRRTVGRPGRLGGPGRGGPGRGLGNRHRAPA